MLSLTREMSAGCSIVLGLLAKASSEFGHLLPQRIRSDTARYNSSRWPTGVATGRTAPACSKTRRRITSVEAYVESIP